MQVHQKERHNGAVDAITPPVKILPRCEQEAAGVRREAKFEKRRQFTGRFPKTPTSRTNLFNASRHLVESCWPQLSTSVYPPNWVDFNP
jgi:hypothetical protein